MKNAVPDPSVSNFPCATESKIAQRHWIMYSSLKHYPCASMDTNISKFGNIFSNFFERHLTLQWIRPTEPLLTADRPNNLKKADFLHYYQHCAPQSHTFDRRYVINALPFTFSPNSYVFWCVWGRLPFCLVLWHIPLQTWSKNGLCVPLQDTLIIQKYFILPSYGRIFP